MLTARLYPKLPTFLRFVAASLRGYQLQRRRYGPRTEQLVEEALERERWDSGSGAAGRRGGSSSCSTTRPPTFRTTGITGRSGGGKVTGASAEQLENWPILSKQVLRENPAAFVAEAEPRQDCSRPRRAERRERRCALWQSRETLSLSWYALVEARIRRWNGVTLQRSLGADGRASSSRPSSAAGRPSGSGITACTSSTCRAITSRPAAVAEYVEAMRRYRVRYLFGYPSAMHALALRDRSSRDIEAPRLEVAISNAEPLLGYQRDRHRRGVSVSCPGHVRTGRDRLRGQRMCRRGRCTSGRRSASRSGCATRPMSPSPRDDAGRMICTALLSSRHAADPVRDRRSLGILSIEDGVPCGCGRSLPEDPLVRRPHGGRHAHAGRRLRSACSTRSSTSTCRFGRRRSFRRACRSIRIRVVPGSRLRRPPSSQPGSGRPDADGSNVEVPIETVESIPRTNAGKVPGPGFDARYRTRLGDCEARFAECRDAMKVGILTQYYPPEMGAPQARLSHLAETTRAPWARGRRPHRDAELSPRDRVFPGYGGLGGKKNATA